MNTLESLAKRYNFDVNEPFVRIKVSRHWELPRILSRLKFTVGAEVGVAEGFFSTRLLSKIPNLKLYSIDSWENYPEYLDYHGIDLHQKYEEAVIRLKPYNCEIIKAYSMDAVKRFADESLDFVYIDAAHDYNHVYEDVREWHKKVRPGGIMAGHDFGKRRRYGVVKAVTEWMAKKNIRPLMILSKDPYPTWMYVK